MSEAVQQHYRGYERLLKRLDEGVSRYNRDGLPVVYDFFAADEIQVIRRYLGHEVPYTLTGGYPDAFKQILIIGEGPFDPADVLVCLSARFNPKFNALTHRDVLGAVYHLQVDQRQFGDMWIEDDSVYLYVTRKMEPFFRENLTRIGRCPVQFEALGQLPAQQFRFRERRHNLSSLRLDRVVAALIGHSRAKAQEKIRGQQVAVNFAVVEDCDQLCHNGDILSVRGVGRFRIAECEPAGRSGRFVVRIEQYL